MVSSSAETPMICVIQWVVMFSNINKNFYILEYPIKSNFSNISYSCPDQCLVTYLEQIYFIKTLASCTYVELIIIHLYKHAFEGKNERNYCLVPKLHTSTVQSNPAVLLFSSRSILSGAA